MVLGETAAQRAAGFLAALSGGGGVGVATVSGGMRGRIAKVVTITDADAEKAMVQDGASAAEVTVLSARLPATGCSP